jgi:cell division protein FtsL
MDADRFGPRLARGAARVVEETMFHTRGRVTKARSGKNDAPARAGMPAPLPCRAQPEPRRGEGKRPLRAFATRPRRAESVVPRLWRRILRPVRLWADEFDPSLPRPVDYGIASVLLLLLALAYVGERSYAMRLNRQSLELEERTGTLQSEVEMLVAEANALADRGRVVTWARDNLHLQIPGADAVGYIYYVQPPAASRAGSMGWGSTPRRGP